ncbi:hypothetical protein [Acinetobacter bouvetii]|uniref:hypothetical protein n=1 Tax=Acinetobacter bouvetii TaxID=202951 RepID=UPI001BC86C44|nr:hypothetical protein [Acinetobacter bouvetii]
MATAPRRTTRTPGAKTEVKDTAQASTDDVLDSVLGKAETPAADPEEKPQTAEDVLADILSGDAEGQEEAPEGFISLEQFDAVAADLTEAQEQLAATQKEFTAFKNDVAAMLIRVAELQGKPQPVIENTGAAQAVPVKKRMKSVLGPKGWMQVEVEE